VDPIIIEALLVRGEGEQVRVILGPHCLDFDADDLLDLEPLPLPSGLREGSAIAARVTLKPGARLLGLNSSKAYQDVLWDRAQPFALATRPLATFQADAAMKAREHAFFAARGLKEHLR
jgi:hypothetical protein